MENAPREHDLVIYGATGFVGSLIAAHVAEHAPSNLRVGLAGRSRERLDAARSRLPARAREWRLIEADSDDADSLAGMAESTRVLLTTVGPYAKYGLPVVEACVHAGTHYADLTGEVSFIREVIDRYDALAGRNGVKLVHSCGYDSVPSDLAVLLLHQTAEADGAGGLTDVELVATAKGGFSGGTIDSLRGQLDGSKVDPALRALLDDPHALSPDRRREPTAQQPPDAGPLGRSDAGTWTAPFVMAPFNTRIVRRSNALQGWAYGRSLRYGEVSGTGRGLLGAVAAGGTALGMKAFTGAMSLRPTRALLDRVLPAPGDGPSPEARQAGWFRSEVTARTEHGNRYRALVAGAGDPGYAATAVMAGEAALALALDGDRLPDVGGSLTPATAFGKVLVDRLRTAGQTYEVTRLS